MAHRHHDRALSRIESDNHLRLCYEHLSQPELTYRHRWQPGDVVIWDNQATLHYATDYYGGGNRLMRRVTVAGSVPVGPDGTPSDVVDDPFIAVR